MTAVGGYPTDSWGADGYGAECSTEGARPVETSLTIVQWNA